ncbi:uncharacterized protein CXorf38 homolog [Trichomycterus rosablanca]|uniref:uncharacterized protein CXorf38 homolog n=1 Tax=Trichomycterus rosablanca TaxID=2290929 RepID=UPI002F35F8D1
MDSYKRFRDENYKNWLKTAESLCILRSHIREFVENETETYHTTLKKQLKKEICTSKCTLKTWKRGPKFRFCDKCELWKNAILENHNSKKSDIHWNNSVPHLWHQDKWEVAKVYMIRGVQNHHSFEEFDLSSILNFMDHCKHFARFKKGDSMTKVISVRNKVMHSPDFRFTRNEMADGIQLVLKLAQILENHAPGLKTISEEIEKFSKVLEMYTGEDSQSGEDSKVDNVKLLDREQAALKEKLEFLTKRFEEDNPTEFKEELLGLKTFVDQNKDLLENLGPQISQINVLQEKVDEHEQKITDLKDRVDQLEKDIPEPVFSGNPPKYKNHVFEEARKRKMPEPVFGEEQEAEGYRGVVEVNSKSFKGIKVWNSKIEAHQDVAKIALDFMKSNPEWTEESSLSGDNPVLRVIHQNSRVFCLKKLEKGKCQTLFLEKNKKLMVSEVSWR